MAFSAAGIQTGTDTDLTGLLSITGVTSATEGAVTVYTVPATFTDAIRIQGTLSHNTERERIRFQRALGANASGNTFIWIDGGTYNFGVEKFPGIFTDGVGLQFEGTGTANNWFNGGFNASSTSVNGTFITVGNNVAPAGGELGGTLNINGGRISGRFNITVRPSGVITNSYGAKFLIDSDTQAVGQEWLCRLYGGTFDEATNLSIEGGSISLGNGSGGATMEFNRVGAGLAYWPQHPNGPGDAFVATDTESYPTIRNVTFTSNTVDIAPWENGLNICGTRVQNCANGTNININGGEVGPQQNNAGYVWVTRQIETGMLDLATQSPVSGTILCYDTDRQSRLSDPTTSVATGQISYRGTFSDTLTDWTASGTGTGVVSINTEDENEVALAFWSLVHDGSANPRGTIDTGLWAVDRRSNGGIIGVDDFTFYTYAYGFDPIAIDADLAGSGILTLSENYIVDGSITEQTEATVGAYTNVDTTNTAITLTANASLDQIYDRAMWNKVNTPALNTSAATAADWIFSGSSGGTVNAGAATIATSGGALIMAGITNNAYTTSTAINLSQFADNNADRAITLTTTGGFTNFPATLGAGLILNGTFNASSNATILINDVASVDGLTLDVDAGVTLSIRGAVAADFAGVTGAGTVNFLIDYVITNDRTAGLQTVFRTNGGVTTIDATATTAVTNILANEIVDVVYTETGRTDFLQRITAGVNPAPATIAIMNSPTPYPSSAVIDGLLVPLAPADYTFPGAFDATSNPLGGMTLTVMQINVTEPAVSETEVSTALQEQVKATVNYNTLIQMVQITDLIQSSGSQGVAAANGDHVLFTSMIPAQVGYVDPIGQDENSQALSGATTTGTFTPTGGSPTNLTIGVVMQQIAAFDPAVTGGQINDAVEQINMNTDAEFAQVTDDVRAMRDNRLLGLKPQTPRSSS